MSNIQKRIRFVNSDGPLVPMVVLEPIGKDIVRCNGSVGEHASH